MDAKCRTSLTGTKTTKTDQIPGKRTKNWENNELGRLGKHKNEKKKKLKSALTHKHEHKLNALTSKEGKDTELK